MNEREQKLIEEWLHTNPYMGLGEYYLEKGKAEIAKEIIPMLRDAIASMDVADVYAILEKLEQLVNQ